MISEEIVLRVITGFVAVPAGMALDRLALLVVVASSVSAFPAGYGSAVSFGRSVTPHRWGLQAVVVMSQRMFVYRGAVLLLVQDSNEG